METITRKTVTTVTTEIMGSQSTEKFYAFDVQSIKNLIATTGCTHMVIHVSLPIVKALDDEVAAGTPQPKNEEHSSEAVEALPGKQKFDAKEIRAGLRVETFDGVIPIAGYVCPNPPGYGTQIPPRPISIQ